MKTAEQWRDAIVCDISDEGLIKTINEIRLEAWKQGMTDAAKIVSRMREGILDDRDEKTEL